MLCNQLFRKLIVEIRDVHSRWLSATQEKEAKELAHSASQLDCSICSR
jgi:hypothetical protein